MVKILIADDHMIVRKGVVFLCQKYFSPCEVDEVETGRALMNALKAKAYSHLILDLELADGLTIKVIPAIRDLYPTLPIMIFTAQKLDMYVGPLSKYGISFIFAKDQSERDTLNGMRQFITNPCQAAPPISSGISSSNALSPREIEVLGYLLKGLKNSEIAKRLNLTRPTISTYFTRIKEKTGAKNTVEIRKWATLFFKKKVL